MRRPCGSDPIRYAGLKRFPARDQAPRPSQRTDERHRNGRLSDPSARAAYDPEHAKASRMSVAAVQISAGVSPALTARRSRASPNATVGYRIG